MSVADTKAMSAVKLALLASRLRENEHDMQLLAAEPIAVIGMACRMPGGIDTPADLWSFLKAGGDAIAEVPRERWDARAYFDADPAAPGKINTCFGGFLSRVDEFDPMVFGIAPREALYMDPQQRLLLEVAWEAFDDAGWPLENLRGTRTGVFFGMCNSDYGRLQLEVPEAISAHTLSGTAPSISAGRVSYLFDLRGPSMVIDTACSSSLVAVHAAVQSLRTRESSLAVAGGISLNLAPEQTISLAKWGMLAPDGRCKTFDSSANGFVRSEGCALIVMKRLADALRDGDRIYGVIRASAINQDGRSNVLTAPNGEAQRDVIRAALAQARLAAHDVTYVETHGTGTKVGDPIEVEALIDVLGAPRADGSTCHLGAIKANLGHLEGAAGVAGLVKALLCLEAGAIPRQIHYRELNPLVSLDGTVLRIPTALTPWPRGPKPRIAGVSSFGFSGTNAHVLIEEAPALPKGSGRRRAQIVPLSAKTAQALHATVDRYAAAITDDVTVEDVAFTAGVRRKHQPHRAAFVGSSPAELRNALAAYAPDAGAAGNEPRVAFLYSGQGSGWHGMARGLLRDEEVFKASVERCDAVLKEWLDWRVSDLLGADDASWLQDTERYQVVLFTLQVALTDLWSDWGIKPAAVAGHSIGEIAAAYAAGALTLPQAAEIVVRRATAMQRLAPPGAMAVADIGLALAEEIIASCGGGLVVAAHNGPSSVTVAGEIAAIDRFVAHEKLVGRFVRRLAVERAFHSPQMSEAAEQLRKTIGPFVPHAASVALYSSVTGDRVDGDTLTASYWARNLRDRVRFADASAALLRDGYRQFVEIGPHPALLPAITAADGVGIAKLPSLRRGRDDRTTMLESLAALYASGCSVEWRKVADERAQCVSLPPYAWQRERYWFEAQRPAQTPTRKTGSDAPLLGMRVDSPFVKGVFYETVLSEDSPAWLAEHRLAGACVLPAAGLVEIALAAAARLLGKGQTVELVDGVIQRALVVPRGKRQQVQIGLSGPTDGRWSLQIVSRADGSSEPWQTHFECGVRASSELPASLAANASGGALDLPRLYADMAARGVELGTAFRRLAELRSDGRTALGTIAPESAAVDAGYVLSPPLLDACFHSVAAFFAGTDTAWLPIGFERVVLLRQPRALVKSAARLVDAAARSELAADLTLFDETDSACVEIRGFRVRSVALPTLQRLVAPSIDSMLHELEWEASPSKEAKPARGAWLIVGDPRGIGERLAAALRADGAECVVADCAAAGSGFEQTDAARRRIDPSNPEHYARLLRERPAGANAYTHVVLLAALHARAADAERDPFLAQAAVSRCALYLLRAFGAKAPAELWLVTSGAQRFTDEAGERQATLWGLGSVLDHELPETHCRLVDLDPGDDAAEHAAALVAEAREMRDAETRIAWSGTRRYVQRLKAWGSTRRHTADDEPWEMRTPASGRIEDLAPSPASLAELGADDVSIETRAVGLNFRDVLNSLGMLGVDAPILGGECAGVVTAVGANVDRALLGQRVMAFAKGAFSSRVVVPASQVARLPTAMGYAEGAGLPVVFLTALYGLRDLAALQPGETVLIHAAAGGVGLAALQVAKQVGARVIATAGSAAKQAYLKSLGVEHVLSSRTLEFEERVLALTQGRGVDVVLNSLSDQFVAASFAALAKGGRFIELGKRGTWSREEAAARRPDARYLPFDLSEVAAREPQTIASLFARLGQGLAAGQYRPIPWRSYAFEDCRAAFEYMAQARHIGKLVIRAPGFGDGAGPPVRAEGTYLITGAAGGLARWLALDLVECGARHLALLVRNPPTAELNAVVEQLRAAGAKVAVLQCDVADAASVDRAVSQIEASLPPLLGVFHLAGVIDDAPVATLSWDRFSAVLAPKILGTKALERRTASAPLEHFVLYSSVASVLGWPGQSAYAAGNAFLDAVARRRQASGLPAQSINWGPWANAGLAAETADARGTDFAKRGLGLISREEGDAALAKVLGSSVTQAVAAWIEPDKLRPGSLAASAAPETASERPEADGAAAARARFREQLAAAQGASRLKLAATAVEREARRVLGLKPDYRFDALRPLNDLGLDSLLAVQLANSLGALFDAPVSATLLFDYPTIDALSRHLEELTRPAAAAPEIDAADAAAAVEELSEADAEAQLLAELENLRQMTRKT